MALWGVVDVVDDASELAFDDSGRMLGIRARAMQNVGAYIAPAGLGASFVKVAQGFRIERVYRSDPELPSEASPLA